MENVAARYADPWNNYEYFGTVGRSMFTLLNIAILAEWPEIGRAVWEKQPFMILVFILFMIVFFIIHFNTSTLKDSLLE